MCHLPISVKTALPQPPITVVLKQTDILWVWVAWTVFQRVTPIFTKLSLTPEAIDDEDLQIIEEFVVLMYDRSSSCKEVNEARVDLFARKQRAYDSIPPTKAVLREHCKRAAYQAGHIWSKSLICNPNLPSPQEWGWEQIDNVFLPYWTTMAAVAKSCQELSRCSCKDCKGRCTCYKSGLSWTAFCSCTC